MRWSSSLTFASAARASSVGLVEHGGRRVGGRRQLAQEVRAGVVDEEEVRALGVVRAARRASGHVQVRLGHDRRAVPRVGERPVGHREAGAPRQRDQDRLLEVGERRARLLRGPAQRAGLDRAAAAHPVRAPAPDRGQQRTLQERVESGLSLIGHLIGHDLFPFDGCSGVGVGGTTGRHGANALAPRGSTAARSGQWRRIRLVMPLFATQSMPNGV